jgi:hypothetical protein
VTTPTDTTVPELTEAQARWLETADHWEELRSFVAGIAVPFAVKKRCYDKMVVEYVNGGYRVTDLGRLALERHRAKGEG